MTMRRHRDWILGCAGLYLAVLCYMFVFQRAYLYFPDGERPDPAIFVGHQRPQVIEIKTRDGVQISGWLWMPEHQSKLDVSEVSRPIIVYFHGNAQDYPYWVDKAHFYQAAGYGFLLAEYRGYGGNAEHPTEEGLYDDARGYLDFLINSMRIDPQYIVLMGESLGGGVAVQMALEYPVRALILESTYTSTADVAKETYWFLPVDWLMWDQFRSIDKIASVEAELLILHGTHDALIPYSHAESLYAKARQNKKLIKIEGGGHGDLYARGAGKYVVGFLGALDYSSQKTR